MADVNPKDLTGEKKERFDALMTGVHVGAEAVLKQAPENRERFYLIIRDSMPEEQLAKGTSKATATEFCEKFEEWVRALVKMIENRGGAAGGTA